MQMQSMQEMQNMQMMQSMQMQNMQMQSMEMQGMEEPATYGSHGDKDQLVDEVKRIQRSSVENKEVWYSFCRMQGTSSYDPTRHDEAFLEKFLSNMKSGSAPISALALSDKATLVNRVKAFQRSGQENKELWYSYCQMNGSPDFAQQNKELWYTYCQMNGSTDFDPARHNEAFLRTFLESVDTSMCSPYSFSGSGKGGKGTTEQPVLSEKIFVGGLPKTITDEQVSAHFSKYGNVRDVNMKYDEKGACRGFCFVTFDAIDSAKTVLDNYENNTIEGKWIECKAAMPQERSSIKPCKGKGKGDGWDDGSNFGWG
eukprot:CAMPEP_0179306464 /NCGR_PEP_ID=MMETSP0797-20121207/50145_1 /TAXON_ID=47934 /ORGANISM="Dinophysis acuminata, Strain DAEP01" /LENGTH=312 /DNA_ID=CAMNT_0021016129 /DNA_START=89 /DNA_END=1025 /DNA_ORIENTATION=+